MRGVLTDLQNTESPFATGQDVNSAQEVRDSLAEMASHASGPFVAELVREDGESLTLAIGDEGCAVQHTTSGGAPPHRVVVSASAGDGHLEFLCGDTPTPIARRNCVTREVLVEIAERFLSGVPLGGYGWEVV